jgi:eukaryotic-like serine/threonine-protein kinase
MPAAARRWRSLSLPWTVFLGGTLALLVLLALVFVLLARWTQRSGEAIVRRELEQSADLAGQFLSARQRSLAGGARVFVQDPNFRSFVHEHLRDEVRDQALEAEEQLEANWTIVVDDSGIVLAKSDEFGAAGANMGGVPLIAGALQGRVTTGFGISGDTMLFQAVAVPIVVPGQAPIGALVATKAVDSSLAADVKAATSAEIVFYLRSDGAPRLVATSFARPTPLSDLVVSQTRSRAVVNGVRYATQGAAVTTAGGDIIGGYVVMSARDAASAEIAEVRRALLIAALAGVALLGLAALAVDRRVSRPLRELADLARSQSGDANRSDDSRRSALHDEVAAAAVAVRSLVDDVRDRGALTSTVTAAIPVVSALHASVGVARAESPPLSMLRVQGSTTRVGPTTSRPNAPPHSVQAPAESVPGEMIAGRYRIDAVLGSGELGVTYRARDRVTGSVVALKRFRAARLGDDKVRLATELREELRGTAHLLHRNVVRVRDVGEESGVLFVTMDLVEGLSLATLLGTGSALTEESVLSIARQLCRALVAAERVHAVHGSISPYGILIGFDGLVRVTDFTLARFERRMRGGRGSQSADTGTRSSEIPQLAGATVGAPEYMSPEQLIGEEPTTHADIYAAGVVLYECVTGATPFRTDSPLAFLAQKLGDAELAAGIELDPGRPARSAAPRVLSEVITRMIAPDPVKRARSAGELLALLERTG